MKSKQNFDKHRFDLRGVTVYWNAVDQRQKNLKKQFGKFINLVGGQQQLNINLESRAAGFKSRANLVVCDEESLCKALKVFMKWRQYIINRNGEQNQSDAQMESIKSSL